MSPSPALFRTISATLVAIAAILSFAASAGAAGPTPIVSDEPIPGDTTPANLKGKLGEMPGEGAAGLQAALRGASARKGAGLPSYKSLLGRDWKQVVAKADRRFAAKLDASEAVLAPDAEDKRHRAAADPVETFDRTFKLSDKLKGKGGKQIRKLKVAAELDGGCPRPAEIEGFGWTATARATYDVQTTERAGPYDVVTGVTIDMNFGSRPFMNENATAESFHTASYGRVEIVRNQWAINRKTGKQGKIGEPERFSSSLGPGYTPDGDFTRFVNSQEDGAPAPPRPLRAKVWDDVSEWFVGIPYNAVRSRVLDGEKLARTPNRCVKLDLPADTPTHLAPGQAVNLRGIPKLVEGNITPFYILQETGRLPVDWINYAGQQSQPLGQLHQMWNGKPWYSFTAPAETWSTDRPVGLKLGLISAAGIAEVDAKFLPESPNVHYEILDASISTDTDASRPSSYCGEVGGSKEFDATLEPEAFSPDNRLTVDEDGDIAGEVAASVQGQIINHTVFGCKSPNQQYCEETMAPRTRSDLVAVSFSNAAEPGKVQLHWAFDNPEVGFVDAGDPECNSHVWGYFDPPVNRTVVDRDDLQASGPITLTLAGSGHIDEHAGREPASIDHTWEYKLTIQRVDENGDPVG